MKEFMNLCDALPENMIAEWGVERLVVLELYCAVGLGVDG